jgi:hypothetical protein
MLGRNHPALPVRFQPFARSRAAKSQPIAVAVAIAIDPDSVGHHAHSDGDTESFRLAEPIRNADADRVADAIADDRVVCSICNGHTKSIAIANAGSFATITSTGAREVPVTIDPP